MVSEHDNHHPPLGNRAPTEDSAVNGISADDRTILIGQLSDARTVRDFSGPWEIKAAWTAGFKSEAEVRGHRIHFDQPGDIRADDTAPTPHEYFIASVAGCLIAGVVMHATVRGVQLHSVKVTVSGTFENVLRWAGIESEGNPGYRGVEVTAAISGAVDDDTIRDIWDRAVAGSPVAQSVNRRTPVVSVLTIV
ncbi:OsmC family protein [Mycolicibacterium komossense]|uniref:OsmC family protein n=1 Tax=Mycolicibacterium komossense TaxID=1779 RepID=A0ABT3CF42_9MYCO|nr:OsmC family protein [Mycolicibacterium komossense]MCV7228103.1 OsmC family protein [Mycolicibacterium komossense]